MLNKDDEREFEIVATGARTQDGEVTSLSLKRIALDVAWKRLAQYRENEVTFTCILRGKNRGGYLMEVADLNVPGFLPRSQASSELATANEVSYTRALSFQPSSPPQFCILYLHLCYLRKLSTITAFPLSCYQYIIKWLPTPSYIICMQICQRGDR